MIQNIAPHKPSIAVRFQRAWYEGASWLLLLVPFEWLFRAVVSVRRGLYLRQWLKVYRAPVPVVVVGNITVGGAGKTPAVIALVEALAKKGIRAGVVSRGYGASTLNYPHLVSEQSTATTVGDEPQLIFKRTGVPVMIDPNRSRAAMALAALGEVDMIISDDGLQHYAMARDFEVLLYDEEAAFGNGRCLPAGPLREPLARLKSVDQVLVRGIQESQTSLTIIPSALINVSTGEKRCLDEHGLGRQVAAFAGVALPGLFFSTLQQLGFEVRAVSFPDHHRYTQQDFADVGALPVIMTEKDAVKCGALALNNAWYLQINAQLPPHVIERVVALVPGHG